MRQGLARLWKCIGMTLFCLTMLGVEIFVFKLWNQPGMLVQFTVAWMAIAMLSWCLILFDIRRASLPITGLTVMTLVWGAAVRNPGIAASVERQHAVINHDLEVSAVATTIRTYSEGRCDAFVGRFFANDPLDPKVEISQVGYSQHKDGSFGCYDLLGHLDNPGVDGNGKEIHRVTHPVADLIIDQVDREKAKAQAAEQERQESARRAAAVAAEQQRAQETAVPIAVAVTTPMAPAIPQERCAGDDNHVIVVTREKLDLTKKNVFRVYLQNPLRDDTDTLLVERATAVILTVNGLQENFNGYADVDMEVTSIGDTTVHTRIKPIKLWPENGKKHKYVIPSGVITFVTAQPICMPMASVVTASR